MWHGRSVSVILPTYNERDSIRRAIEEFFETGVVDEIVVVNNNAAPGTSEEVARTPAREVREPRQGYGYAIRRGLTEATGDFLVVSEPDGTFLGRDALKLLAYADDFDVVYGSRTARMLIWRGANMGIFLRWGNWAVAKMMEFLFNSTNLTDVGCTTRLIRRSALERMQPYFTIGGSSFGPEMMLLSLLLDFKVIQIPVNYLPRVGESSVTGDLRRAILLGLTMIGLVLRYRLRSWLGWRAPTMHGEGAP
jgi:glycosyltransferase involved in cell wall biosynthesis